MAFDQESFRAAYGAFLRPGRVLLTGHSHQAWPDVAREAMTRYFDDSAEHVDDKWSRAVFPIVDRVGRRILGRMGFDESDGIAFGRSTHELVYRLISALPGISGGGRRPRIVTTTGEFHSLDRQLRRLEEDGVEVVWVPAMPRAGLAERLVSALHGGADLLAVSAVLFEDSHIVGGLERVLARAVEVGAVPLVDAYHGFNVVPLAWGSAAPHVYVTAGGYKYASFGEGLCWLRVPSGSTLRPVYTGWFADFDALERPRFDAEGKASPIGYGPAGARFAGATFDPVAFYRADAVLGHFERFGLGVPELRAISTRQTRRIVEALDAAKVTLASSRVDEERGGFVAAVVPDAHHVVARLREHGVLVDARGDRLRFGPAPYLTDDEIDRGISLAVDEIRRA